MPASLHFKELLRGFNEHHYNVGIVDANSEADLKGFRLSRDEMFIETETIRDRAPSGAQCFVKALNLTHFNQIENK
jgi:hypothetical protein